MGVLFKFQRSRPTILHGVAKPMEQTESGIPSPGKNQFPCTTHADHLVIDDVGAEPNEREIPPSLSDDLVSGGKRHQMTETFKRDTVAVVHEFRNRFSQRCYLKHATVAANHLPLRWSFRLFHWNTLLKLTEPVQDNVDLRRGRLLLLTGLDHKEALASPSLGEGAAKRRVRAKDRPSSGPSGHLLREGEGLAPTVIARRRENP